jgi:O-antigen/teichoic acid export membrane protein
MLTISAITGLQGRLADLILARMLGLAAFGIFSRAVSLTGILWENFHIVILRVLFADLAEQRRQGRSLRHSYLRLTEVLTGLLWPAFMGISVISGPLVIGLFGEDWIGAAAPLSILAVASAVGVVIMVAQDIFIVSNETARQTRLELIRAPISLGLFTIGCLFSIEAAAAMKVAETVLLVLMYRPHLERMTDTRWADFMPIYGKGLLLTIAAVLPAALLMTSQGWSPHAPLLMVTLGVVAGMLAWIVMLWALRHALFHEGERLVMRLLGRRGAASGSSA